MPEAPSTVLPPGAVSIGQKYQEVVLSAASPSALADFDGRDHLTILVTLSTHGSPYTATLDLPSAQSEAATCRAIILTPPSTSPTLLIRHEGGDTLFTLTNPYATAERVCALFVRTPVSWEYVEAGYDS